MPVFECMPRPRYRGIHMYSLRLSTRMTTVDVAAIRTWSRRHYSACRRPPGFRHRCIRQPNAQIVLWPIRE